MAGFGAFGKIPAAGDFIRFDLSPGFLDPWDRFVQGAMTAARGALGDRWRDCYFSAPIWRFTLSPGQVGQYGALGVLMPSVDRVGRLFPLTLAMPLLSPQPIAQLHFAAGATFRALEAIALAALDDVPPDTLKQRLATVRAPAPCATVQTARLESGIALRLDGPSDIAGVLAAQTVARSYRGPSVWSGELSGGSRLLIREGLPGAAERRALFDADDALWRGGQAV